MSKIRLDQLLADRALCDSREKAKRLILAGEVKVGDVVVSKPGARFEEDSEIHLKEKPKYVSRGGLKLEGAMNEFSLGVAGRICLDVGASTGGFTDCLLQSGATKVYAFDVGTNQLAWKIRSDPRVVSREKFNVRHMRRADLPEEVDLVVIDVSFISLMKILPAVVPVMKKGGELVCLIKPQFELSREEVGKGGIVRVPSLHQKAVDKIHSFATGEVGLEILGHTDSPITGTDGNREFLSWLTKP